MWFLTLSLVVLSVQCNAYNHYRHSAPTYGAYAPPPYNPINQLSRYGQRCQITDGGVGTCLLASNCPSLENLFKSVGSTNWYKNYESNALSACGHSYHGGLVLFCCASITPTPPIIQPTPPFQSNNSTSPAAPDFHEGEGITGVGPSTPGASCTTPDSQSGECKNIRECAPIFSSVSSRRNDPAFTDFIRQSNTACGGQQFAVCCPTPAVSTQKISELGRRFLTPEEGCGFPPEWQGVVIGGQETQPNLLPWMALIGYRDDFGKIQFRCGGSLVTSRHVLTAAHCIRNNIFSVRLGEHNLTDSSYTGRIDVPVIKSTPYPRYRRSDGFGDIAILTLEREIPFTRYATPVCMPVEDRWRGNLTDTKTILAGWGQTAEEGTTSDVLMNVFIPVLENSVCQEKFEKDGLFSAAQNLGTSALCAGVLEGGKDSCYGDSGGPLVVTDPYTELKYLQYQIGVISFSPKGCARANKPGSFTRVVYFLDWIQQEIRK